MNRFYPEVAERAQNRCEYCRAPEQVFNFAFEVEHIKPRAQGGLDSLENLALACEACNLYKASATAGYDAETEADVPLFHPRRDRWEQQFIFHRDSALIAGTTPTGRATIERLKMNAAFQIRARRQWMVLELYP